MPAVNHSPPPAVATFPAPRPHNGGGAAAAAGPPPAPETLNGAMCRLYVLARRRWRGEEDRIGRGDVDALIEDRAVTSRGDNELISCSHSTLLLHERTALHTACLHVQLLLTT